MNSAGGLLLKGQDEEVMLPPDCLLVAIDETGHEEFADDRHPVFGLGGCACLCGHYDRVIRRPWRELKESLFGGEGKPLHAAELHNPSPDQIAGLRRLFISSTFSRLAALTTSMTILSE